MKGAPSFDGVDKRLQYVTGVGPGVSGGVLRFLDCHLDGVGLVC